MTREPGPGTTLALTLAAVLFATAGPVIAAAAGRDRGEVVTPSRLAADRPCPHASPPESERVGGFLVEPVAAAAEPTSLALHPTSTGDGVLALRRGRLVRVEDGRITGEVLHDVSGDTAQDGDGGLLAVTYDPAGDWLYAYRTTAGLDDVITAFRSDPSGRIDPATARRILFVEREPSQQHHGGSLAFGADGYLYIGMGDGGGLGDPRENAQDPGTVLGKVVRIDPTPDEARPYRIPPDNPFVDTYGWRPEVWAAGVRNPFRVSLDPVDGSLWLGDVGQTCWEEINHLTPDDAGANLGWDRFEGPEPFEGGELRGSRHHEPVVAFPHSAGWCAIVTGPVLTDQEDPERDGWLLFTDYCAGALMALDVDHQSGTRILDLGVRVDSPVAIVDGPSGQPWILTLDGLVLELETFSPGPVGSRAATP